MPKQVNRIPGIKSLKAGGYQARVFHAGKEESRNFQRADDAQKWQRNLKKDLERCPEGVLRSARTWQANLITPSGVASEKFSELDDAITWIDRGKVMISLGTWVDPSHKLLDFNEYASLWRATKSSISGKTLGTYDSQLRLHLSPEFGAKPLTGIASSDIRKWVTKLSEAMVGATTIRQSYRLMRQIMEAAFIEERISRNPCVGVKLPKIITADKRGLTREELTALADECGACGPIIMFLGTTGLRIGEALALRVGDFDQISSTVNVQRSWTKDVTGRRVMGASTKTGASRVVPVSPGVLSSLMPMLESKSAEDWVFIGPRGKVMDYDWLRQRVFMPAVSRLGLKGITIHSLRHTCASLLIKLKAPITTVSYILGHSSVKMTLDTYGHYYEDDTAQWINQLGDFVSGAGTAQKP
jgi:integrase